MDPDLLTAEPGAVLTHRRKMLNMAKELLLCHHSGNQPAVLYDVAKSSDYLKMTKLIACRNAVIGRYGTASDALWDPDNDQ
jgi:hypothetical protein